MNDIRTKDHPGCKSCPFRNISYPNCVEWHGERTNYPCQAGQDPLTAEYGAFKEGDHPPYGVEVEGHVDVYTSPNRDSIGRNHAERPGPHERRHHRGNKRKNNKHRRN